MHRPAAKTSELRRLRVLADNGMHQAAIVREMGRSDFWVRKWCRKLGLTLRQQRSGPRGGEQAGREHMLQFLQQQTTRRE